MWALSLLWALSLCWMLPGTLGYGSEVLEFKKINSASIDACKTSGVVIPCIADVPVDLKTYKVTWYINETLFFSFELYGGIYQKTFPFLSVEFQDIWKVRIGVASIKIPLKDAIPGTYSCYVRAAQNINMFHKKIYIYGDTRVELHYGSRIWFQPLESFLVIAAVIMLAALFLLQVGYVAVAFEMSHLKKISFVTAVLIVMNFVVPGAMLLVEEGYTVANQFGLGLVVLPAVILVPPLFFVFQSVFDKLPLLAIILIILKALGYVIAVAGMVASLSECPPKQVSVVMAGLGIMNLVAVLALIYLAVIGTRFEDHQPPKIAVGELRKAKK